MSTSPPEGPVPAAPRSVAEVVDNGLCIGCGLCESVTEGRVQMQLSDRGGMRPVPSRGIEPHDEQAILAACPGAVVQPRQEAGVHVDPVWGASLQMVMAWAGDPAVRHRAATGGVLTALGMHLLASGAVTSILHVGPVPGEALANRWTLSTTPQEVLDNAGSRYSPTAPLAGLRTALDRGEPFAVIAKPCDASAVHAYAAVDERVDQLCVARMVMVCGGQSRMTKTAGAARELGLDPARLTAVRYRGYGNPGPTVFEQDDGQKRTVSYLDMWADESSWDTESRCTICADALGEAADIAASDAWPGGAPTGEDAGFNGVIAYSPRGVALLASATESGALVQGESLTPRDFDEWQPHQVRKKVALAARYSALAAAGKPAPVANGSRMALLGERLTAEERSAEMEGTAVRIGRGRYEG